MGRRIVVYLGILPIGAAVVIVSLALKAQGLDRADKLASVVSLFVGLVALGVSVVGLGHALWVSQHPTGEIRTGEMGPSHLEPTPGISLTNHRPGTVIAGKRIKANVKNVNYLGDRRPPPS